MRFLVLMALLGCDKPMITTLDGAVFTSHDLLSAGLPGADVQVLDGAGDELVSTTTDESGAFQVTLDSGQSVFVVITADGYATTTFPGTVGIETEAKIEDHALYGVAQEELDGWLATFGGCPGVGSGAAVLGQIREYGIQDPYTGQNPTTTAGTAQVKPGRKDALPGCYLDEDGALYDPSADLTGQSGWFGVFGVPPGLSDLVIQVQTAENSWTTDDYPLFVPDAGAVVSPWFPAFSTFPGT